MRSGSAGARCTLQAGRSTRTFASRSGATIGMYSRNKCQHFLLPVGLNFVTFLFDSACISLRHGRILIFREREEGLYFARPIPPRAPLAGARGHARKERNLGREPRVYLRDLIPREVLPAPDRRLRCALPALRTAGSSTRLQSSVKGDVLKIAYSSSQFKDATASHAEYYLLQIFIDSAYATSTIFPGIE